MIQVRYAILFALLALNTTVYSQTTYPKITGYEHLVTFTLGFNWVLSSKNTRP